MGTLVRVDSNRVHLLEAETLVGRSPRSQLAIADGLVSMHHASIRWADDGWQLRDLGSTNGTFVDGRALAADETVRLEAGAQIAFGTANIAYRCAEVNPPCAILIALDGGAIIPFDSALVAVPSPDCPAATFARDDQDGSWMVELGDEARALMDQDALTIDGVRYRFCANRGAISTMAGRCSVDRRVPAELSLELRASRDEEHVELVVSYRGQRHQLGARACYYALLMLARCRLGEGLPPSARADRDGWIATDTLATMLGTTEQHVNVDIFRIRKALQAASVPGAATLIERQSGMLRLVTSHIQLGQI